MKSNLKSGNTALRFLLAHGEKIGIALIAICAVMIIWSSMGVPRLEHQPTELNEVARTAESHVEAFTWNEGNQDEGEILRLDEIPNDPMREIPLVYFPPSEIFWDPPVREPASKRTDPLLLAATELEAFGDAGLWATADPEVIKQRMLEAMKEEDQRERERQQQRQAVGEEGARGRGGPETLGRGAERGGRGARDEDTRRVRRGPVVVRSRGGATLQGYEDINAESWVTVLARVPIKQQNQLYEDALKNSRGYDPRNDRPNYLGYIVQRAEITPSGQGEWENLTTVNRKNLIEEMKKYPVNVPEVVDNKYVHPLLTHPLPPLILREWDDRVSHASMPLESETIEEEPAESEEETEADGEEESMFTVGPRVQDRRAGRGEFERRGEYGGPGEMEYGRGGYGEDRGRGEYAREYGGEYGGEYGRGGYGEMRSRGQRMGRGQDVTLESFTWDRETSDILLRFFDKSAQPGHKYRYRVRLALADVNHEVPEHYLDKSVTERGTRQYRLTDWSEPSPVASVPYPASIFLAEANPASSNNVYSEPELTVLIKALSSQLAAQIARKQTLLRGSVANVEDEAEVIWTSDREPPPDNEDFKFYSGITLIDLEGGERLSSRNRSMTSPSRALLMDPSGKLFVQNELESSPTVEEFTDIVENSRDNRRRGGGEFDRGRGEYGGFGGRGRGEF